MIILRVINHGCDDDGLLIRLLLNATITGLEEPEALYVFIDNEWFNIDFLKPTKVYFQDKEYILGTIEYGDIITIKGWRARYD